MQSTTVLANPQWVGAKNKLFRLLAACVSSLALLLGFALPAQAHDVLVNYTLVPHADDGAQALQLTFNNSIIEVGTEILLTDKKGKEIALPTATVEGPTVTQDLPEDLAPAVYQVAWRVVSSDGHPIEGNLWITLSRTGDSSVSDRAPAGFTSEAGTDSQTGDSAGSDSAGGTASADSADADAAASAGEQAAANGLPLPQLLLLGGGGIVVIALAVVIGAKLAGRSSKK